MSATQIGVFVTLATVLGTVIATVVQAFTVKSTTRKLGAESVNLDVSSAKAVADMAVELLKPYKARIEEQHNEHKIVVAELQNELTLAKSQAANLTIQLGTALAELSQARSELQEERRRRNDPLAQQ